MTYQAIDLSAFPKEREERLRDIYRYSLFEVMLYRPNLWTHENRVTWLVEAMLPYAQKYLTIDGEKARAIAMVHDDAEIITGDVQAGYKAQMTQEQLDEVERNEEEAIEKMVAMYPAELHGYSYKELLTEALKKNTIESQLMSYADKIDAYCETMHDVLAGNLTILGSLIFYTDMLARAEKKFPLITPLFAETESPLINPKLKSPALGKNVNVADFSTFALKPHTPESVQTQTERFPFYDMWKQITVEKGGAEGMAWLTEQREFLPA